MDTKDTDSQPNKDTTERSDATNAVDGLEATSMDTNDSDEINVENSPRSESVEINDNGTPEATVPIARPQVTRPVPTASADDRRNRFRMANPYHHAIREEKLQRQVSDPNPIISASRRHLEGFSLPKQHSEPGPTVFDRIKPSYLVEGPDVPEPYFKVTCGSLEGKLIWQKFVCPGINVRCIRLDRSHHELITPKELVREAGKQTLKDWKRAIRINAKMLRKLMDDNELDYYRHDIQCSNTCKSNKTQPQDSTGSSISRDSSMSSANPSSSFEENPPRQLQAQIPYEHRPFERNSSSEESPDADTEGPMVLDQASPETIANCHRFWSVIKQTDMMDDVLKEIMNKLHHLHSRSQAELRSEDSVMLTNIVNSLDMMSQVRQIIRGQGDMLDQRTKYNNETFADLQKKMHLVQKEMQQVSERKRQIEDIDNLPMKLSKKEGKKARIQKIGRQPAVDQHAAIQPRFLPNSPHSIPPHTLTGSFLMAGPEGISAWHAAPSYVMNQRPPIYSPHSMHSTSDRLSDRLSEGTANHLAGHLSTCSIQSSPERPVNTRSPLPPK